MNPARKADPHFPKEIQPRHHRHDIALVQYYGFSQRCENTQNRKKEGQKNRPLLHRTTRKNIAQVQYLLYRKTQHYTKYSKSETKTTVSYHKSGFSFECMQYCFYTTLNTEEAARRLLLDKHICFKFCLWVQCIESFDGRQLLWSIVVPLYRSNRY